jgi:hypothetical protein
MTDYDMLLRRVLEDPTFQLLSTESFATMDSLRTPAQILRDRADAIEKRDRLIRDLRRAVGP